MTQANRFKIKEIVEKEKEKMKPNFAEMSKKQTSANQIKNSPQMTYNAIDDLTKLRIMLPYMEVVKIPQ